MEHHTAELTNKGDEMGLQITFVFRTEANGYGKNDLDRYLTMQGEEKAVLLREALKKPEFDLILSSPAARAIRTAAIVGGIVNSQDVISVCELYRPMNFDSSDTMTALLRQYGNEAAAAIKRHIDEAAEDILPSRQYEVLVAGHKVLLPIVAESLLQKVWRYSVTSQEIEKITRCDFSEFRGLQIDGRGNVLFIE